jgi:hypothetical protein
MNLTIETLTGNNFKKWKNDVEIYLGCWDLDLALREPEPPVIVHNSTRAEKDKAEKWERDNRLSLKIIKKAMTETVRGGIPECERALDYLKAVEEKYKESDKAEIANHMNSLMNLKFDGIGSVREHCLKLIDIATKLKALESPIADPMLVYLTLNSLPSQYSQLLTTYNTQRDKWSINELISICAQEESRIKKEKGKVVATVNLIGKEENKNRQSKKPFNSSKNFHKASTSSGGSHYPKVNKNPTVFKCFFCEKVGHLKRNCHKYKGWLAKKGNKICFVCFESNLVNVPSDSWWLDTGSPIHIANSLQGFIKRRAPSRAEKNLFVGNGMKVAVEAIGDVRLRLGPDFILELANVFYVPSMRRNLISCSQLVETDFSHFINKVEWILFYKDAPVGKAFIVHGLWQLSCSYISETYLVEN